MSSWIVPPVVIPLAIVALIALGIFRVSQWPETAVPP